MTTIDIARPQARTSRVRIDALTSTALSLMATTVLTSALGVAFWVVAARRYPAVTVGEDSALISMLMLLSIVSQLNLGMVVMRLLPQVTTKRSTVVAGAYGVAMVSGLVSGSLFVTFATRISPSFSFVSGSTAIALVCGIALWNVFALQDAVLTSARRASVVPIENAIFGVLKIALMVWLATRGGRGIFASWVIAMALMIIPTNAFIFGRVLRRGSDAVATHVLPLSDRRRVGAYVLADYAAALLSQGYNWVLPLLVTAVLGRAVNASFYVAFLIAGAIGAFAQSLSTSLVVEGAHDEGALSTLLRRAMHRYVTIVLPVVGVLIVAAPVVLMPFGEPYATEAPTTLRLMLAGTVSQAVVTMYLGVERVRARLRRVIAVEAATVVLVTIGSVAGMRAWGLIGVGIAWLVSQSVMATVVVRPLRRVVDR